MGHMSSSNVIFANDEFYRFNIDKIIRGDDENSTGKNVEEVPGHRRMRLGIDLTKEKRFKRRKAMLQKHYFTMNI